IHYDISDRTREFLTEKLGHIDPFKDLLVSVDATVTKETTEFIVESNVHFKWGATAHLEERAQELYPAIENLVKKLDSKISKEKDKVKGHHPKEKAVE
ncbi:MAG TPA: ribosome-associated translation inhibitor RaiA, partial [Spirochaetia bacterium]|nr:ribosome-associated translation inhibitor RaiA [Spirochaetia bacterium]